MGCTPIGLGHCVRYLQKLFLDKNFSYERWQGDMATLSIQFGNHDLVLLRLWLYIEWKGEIDDSEDVGRSITRFGGRETETG